MQHDHDGHAPPPSQQQWELMTVEHAPERPIPSRFQSEPMDTRETGQQLVVRQSSGPPNASHDGFARNAPTPPSHSSQLLQNYQGQHSGAQSSSQGERTHPPSGRFHPVFPPPQHHPGFPPPQPHAQQAAFRDPRWQMLPPNAENTILDRTEDPRNHNPAPPTPVPSDGHYARPRQPTMQPSGQIRAYIGHDMVSGAGSSQHPHPTQGGAAYAAESRAMAPYEGASRSAPGRADPPHYYQSTDDQLTIVSDRSEGAFRYSQPLESFDDGSRRYHPRSHQFYGDANSQPAHPQSHQFNGGASSQQAPPAEWQERGYLSAPSTSTQQGPHPTRGARREYGDAHTSMQAPAAGSAAPPGNLDLVSPRIPSPSLFLIRAFQSGVQRLLSQLSAEHRQQLLWSLAPTPPTGSHFLPGHGRQDLVRSNRLSYLSHVDHEWKGRRRS